MFLNQLRNQRITKQVFSIISIKLPLKVSRKKNFLRYFTSVDTQLYS